MNSKDQMNFKDPQTIVAIILVFAIFIGWNFYMRNKYPEISNPPPVVATEESKNNDSDKSVSANSADETNAEVGAPTKMAVESERIDLKTNAISTEVENVGLNIQSITLGEYKDKDKNPFVVGSFEKGSMRIREMGGESIPFRFTQKSPTLIAAEATTALATYQATIRVKDQYSFDVEVKADRIQPGFSGIDVDIFGRPVEIESAGFLMPAFGHNGAYFILANGDEESVEVTEPTTVDYQASSVMAVDTQYFAAAIVDNSPIMPTAHLAGDNKTIQVTARYQPITKAPEFGVSFVSYFGPKSREYLNHADSRLEGILNYGMFGFLAHPLLSILKWFHSMVGNWGFAIVLMTLLVKLVVLPLHLMSYKSMKAMQKIQPLMKDLREKYKDDQQRLNQEMMQLMKTHKVNPLGGCLPMLLQLPVFIAFYQVLGSSIELYQAPFMLWIQDLSIKDPYYILPVAMGISMFVQMRMTPTQMDPQQAKIMAFMPVLFTFLMLSLPSGLSLYIFTSTLFTVVQQLVLMRDRSEDGAVSTQGAKA